jgi:hypothetical protein
MLIRKLLEAPFETGLTGALEPARIAVPTATSNTAGPLAQRNRGMARRAMRQHRRVRGAGRGTGGWSVRAW